MQPSLERVQQWLARAGDALVGGQGTLVGLDIGSYGLRAVLADLQTGQLFTANAGLPTGDANATVEAAQQLVQDLIGQSGRDQRHLTRIGIGFGGPVDADSGVTRVSYRQAGWEHFPLAARFEAAFDAPILVDNDANVTALAEAMCGAGTEARDLFYLHLSSGVGGGVVVNGRLYHGATTSAGEVGHATVDRHGPPCSCGGHGHVESYVSIKALLRRLGELGVTSEDIHAIFAADAAAKQTVAEAAELLGAVLANVVILTDPQLIVIGGIVARTGGVAFLEQIRAQMEAALPPTFAHPIPVLPASFGSDSVAVGGLALALASLQE
ncbi:MAG: ROK family protein [Herpetosiphonaceae bacterium]|nr:ROK family protein [Herpetosiphonaceae bacterium]